MAKPPELHPSLHIRAARLMFSALFKHLSAAIGSLLILATTATGADHPAPLAIPDAEAKAEAAMKPYTELIEHTDAKIDMVPIRGGKFLMGSPQTEKGRYSDEGPQHEVEISPFWMAKC